ncbi:TnsA endonuclease N-terminal domain-containing protein [Streptomyces sp. NBC_00304]|uniref:TnsA endonuclease N-terminal domain-containing protein n=1 Tax=Streptomyces sp. NBC_00304 TaxID=2975706 RepID=UPI002E2B4132|nr:TnsA endonuclease N-terminal domain-containing protein [Streptomyces sp. NBC_00304]
MAIGAARAAAAGPAVADVPLVQGAAALFGHVLVGDRGRSSDLRVAAGAGAAVVAGFAPEVRQIVAQPFLLKADVDGKVRKHIPDYLLLTDDGPVVVDVKPRHRLEKPEVAFTFAWTQEAVTSRGWQYEVWSEPDPHVLENVDQLGAIASQQLAQ